MRILMVTPFPLPGEYDGSAMLPIQILRGLKGRGVDVRVAYLRARPPWGKPVRSEFEGITIDTLPMLDWIAGLERIHREFPFDLVQAEHYGGATRAYAACRRHGWPMVYQIHSLLGDEVERGRLGRGLKFRAYRAIERRACRDAAAVIALGAPVKRVVVEEKGAQADRVAVIHPSVDIAPFEVPTPPTEIPGVGPDDRVIMYIGSIVHPNQGVPILVDALPEVARKVPGAKLVLVGGPASAGEEYRKRLGEHGNCLIVLTGTHPDALVGLTRRADVLVHPRLACRENYSVQTKMGVYLAAGRPIVATDFGDYKALLGDTGAGLLTAVAPGPLAEGIVRVLADPALAESLASRTLAVAHEHFGREENLDRLLAVYRRVLAAGPRAA